MPPEIAEDFKAEGEFVRSLEPSDKLAALHTLFVDMLLHLEGHAVVAVYNLHHIDPESWAVFKEAMDRETPLVFVFTSRPVTVWRSRND